MKVPESEVGLCNISLIRDQRLVGLGVERVVQSGLHVFVMHQFGQVHVGHRNLVSLGRHGCFCQRLRQSIGHCLQRPDSRVSLRREMAQRIGQPELGRSRGKRANLKSYLERGRRALIDRHRTQVLEFVGNTAFGRLPIRKPRDKNNDSYCQDSQGRRHAISPDERN